MAELGFFRTFLIHQQSLDEWPVQGFFHPCDLLQGFSVHISNALGIDDYVILRFQFFISPNPRVSNFVVL